MEWYLTVNEMLQDEITKLDSSLLPPGFQGDPRNIRIVQESLSRAVDALGAQSAAAQGLGKVITTADKLRAAPKQTLYLLKDAAANQGAGELVGLLKVGRKHLFLCDERARVRELEPLCVLDFYVRRERQRHGLGRRLFAHMLHDCGARAEQLAVDGPSPRMEQFLRHAYGVERLIRQSNNFAVAPQFFACAGLSEPAADAPAAVPAVGRFTARKPPSAIATVIHGAYCSERGAGAAGAGGAGAAPRGVEHERDGAATPGGEATRARSPEPSPAPSRPPSPARPSSLPVSAAPPGPGPQAPPAPGHGLQAPPEPSPAGSARRDSQLTERGYFDVKFYHNKLW